MKNYKTTFAGLLASVGLLLATNDDPFVSAIGKVLEGFGLLMVGFMAKDHNVTGNNTKP